MGGAGWSLTGDAKAASTADGPSLRAENDAQARLAVPPLVRGRARIVNASFV
jgi:hypothetical protein